jgi:uncharacterized protein YjbJ (UPF0337 family)
VSGKENTMSLADKAKSKAEELKGNLKQAGEKIKDTFK